MRANPKPGGTLDPTGFPRRFRTAGHFAQAAVRILPEPAAEELRELVGFVSVCWETCYPTATAYRNVPQKTLARLCYVAAESVLRCGWKVRRASALFVDQTPSSRGLNYCQLDLILFGVRLFKF